MSKHVRWFKRLWFRGIVGALLLFLLSGAWFHAGLWYARSHSTVVMVWDADSHAWVTLTVKGLRKVSAYCWPTFDPCQIVDSNRERAAVLLGAPGPKASGETH